MAELKLEHKDLFLTDCLPLQQPIRCFVRLLVATHDDRRDVIQEGVLYPNHYECLV